MTHRYDQTEIRSILRRKDREDLTYAELSAETGIPIGTIAGWRRRYGSGSESFMEIDLDHTDEATELEVIGPRGHRVVIPPDVDEDLLRRVLTALPC